MKKLSIFIFSILLLSCICYSQDTTNNIKPDFDKSGFYLQKASANLKASYICGLSSIGLAIFGATLKENKNPDMLYFTSGALGVIGLTCTIAAVFNIGKAGDYLRGGNKNKIVLQSSKDGIGLAFKF